MENGMPSLHTGTVSDQKALYTYQDCGNQLTSTFGQEQEPNWLRTLKEDIRSIIRNELAYALFNQNLKKYASPQDQLSQEVPDNVPAPSSLIPARGTSTANSPNDVSEAWKNNWKYKQEARMTKKLAIKEAPFPVNHLYRMWKSYQEFLDSRPVPDTALARLVSGRLFTSFFLLLIVGNAFWMAFEAHHTMEDTTFRDRSLSTFMKWFFTIAFMIELCLKLLGSQWQFIAGDEWKWNLFDTVMVTFSLVSLIFEGAIANMTFARVLKLVRMIRVLRLFRVVASFLELRHMIVALQGSLVTLFWCAILFLFVQFCFAVMTMQLAGTYIAEATTPAERNVAAQLQHHYGSIWQAMLTLFHTISGGDWLVAAAPLNQVISGYNYVFAAYIFFITFGLLNVVIGLFCDKASGAVESDRDLRTLREWQDSEDFIAEMRDIFQEMDTHKKGEIQWEQFEEYITEEGTGHFLRSHGIATHDAWELFALLDEMDDNPSGSIDVVSFVMGMQRLTGTSSGTDIVLSIVENRKKARAMEASIADIRVELVDGFGHIQNLLLNNSFRPTPTPTHLAWEI